MKFGFLSFVKSLIQKTTMESILNRIPYLERRYQAHRNRRTSASPNSTGDTQPVICSQGLDDDHLFVKPVKACDTSVVEVTSSDVNLACGAN